jgi:hypothetical protein
MNLGDFDTSTVIYQKFTTYRPSTGAPFTLAGSPVLSVYKDNSTTQSTTGVTLTVDFDSVTGLHHLAIDTSADGTFYSAGSFFDVVITTGTVDSVSAVGTVVARFTLRKNSALKPTTAGRTLDVSAGGEAGLDWANVGSPTTALNLSGTTISSAQAVASVSGAVGSVTGSVGSVTGAVGSVVGAVGSVTGSVGSVVGLTVANLDAAISSRASAANLAIVGGYIDTEIAAIKAKTDNLPASPAATGDAMTLASGERDSVADALLARNVSGGSSAGRTVKQALHVLRNKTAIAAGTLTVYDTDDSTTSFTATVTTAAGDPITSIDPA